MSDATINADVIKRTQDTLGKYVRKPPLTEKLLQKPPFRFLFDVVGVVISETGCFEGLYTPDELNIENINDREKKIQFLQKLIDVIKIATNEPLTVKSSKIVAGRDPEKTNELLQQMGIIIENKIDWKSAVDAVNNSSVPIKTKSKSKVKEKESKEKIPADKPSPKDREAKKERTKTDAKEKTKSNDALAKKSPKANEPEKKEKERKAKSKPPSRDGKDTPKKASPEKPSKPKTDPSSKPEPKVKSKELKSVPSEEKVTSPTTNEPVQVGQNEEEKIEMPTKSGSPSAEYKRDKRRASKRAEEILLSAIAEDSSSSENRRPSASKRSFADSRKSSAEKARLLTVDENSVKPSPEPTESLKTVPPPPEAVRSPVAKSETRPDSGQNVEVKRETTFVRENSKDSANNPPRPRTSLRPPSARPASARPGAPRRRDKNIEIILQPNDQIKVSRINVKLESFTSELEDGGENLVIIENPNTVDPLLESRLDTVKAEEDEILQQGHLVQQILETQKELVHGSSPDTDQKLEKEYDVIKSTNRQSSARQMNSLRDLIQNLTKSVNPLGKLMDFIPEDIDSMQLELTMWRDTYNQSSVELKKERSLTESVTEPMKNQLINMEATIKEYQEMIDACRVKILQNADKIQRLLTTP